MSSESLEIHQLFKTFGNSTVIDNLDLTVASGSFTALMGPSGCGKSTLLRLLAGLDKATSGSIQNPQKNNTSLVFQESNLVSWRTALENVLLPFEINPHLNSLALNERKERALKILEQVGLKEVSMLFPHQLSGGMKMRVALARALVTRPRLLLMDEPFAALDEITRFDLQIQLRQLWLKEKMTVIFVTHSVTEAVFLADRIVCLQKRGAKILVDQTNKLATDRTNALRTSVEYNQQVEAISSRLHS